MRSLKLALILPLILLSELSYSQQLLTDMIDTSKEIGRSMLSIYQKFGSLKLTGYIQPQFQFAEEKGAKSFEGGDFAAHSNNRFMLRRSRIKVDYAYINKKEEVAVYFVFQFDATERGVFARDIWGRFLENKFKLFYLTTGLFARPFGYEVNYSSAERESPERGRMSQILMKTERDMGVMLSFEPRKKDASLKFLKVDLGLFNGQGLAGPVDYDSYKDIIGRVSVKPTEVKTLGIIFSGGASFLYGSIGSQSSKLMELKNINNTYSFDSTIIAVDAATPRHYYGADVQIKLPNPKGFSELRAEYIRGTQTATATSSETPGVYPVTNNGSPQSLYVRPFDGAYFYYLQHLFSTKHQLIIKYDWYDPNIKVEGTKISATNGFSQADIKFTTFGLGYIYYVNPHLKAVFYYDIVKNEHTNITDYTSDAKDNVFTFRLQYRF